MTEQILFYVRNGLLLIFGVLLSAAFAGIRPTKKSALALSALMIAISFVQLNALLLFSEEAVWKLYPPLTHLPTLLLLCFGFRKRLSTALAAVTTAYICCQPAKWFGLLAGTLTSSIVVEHSVHIFVSLVAGIGILLLLSPSISSLYGQDSRTALLFSIVPTLYYLFDYSVSIYSDIWMSSNQIAIEFLPFLLCTIHLIFCAIYSKEYEQKADAERKEQIIRITVEQQKKEVEAMKRSEQEIRMLRHDMRLILRHLALCLEEGDMKSARKMVSGFTDQVDSTVVKRYCENPAVNYILSDCAAKCHLSQISFHAAVELDSLPVDEILFSSILSNALDNAVNAQQALPPERRQIRMMLKIHDGRLLFSVRNPFRQAPRFSNGMPVSTQKGHGYGTQSILYLTQRLGGHCQFTLEGDQFVLRVVI